jgi:activator of HSP90 ATPase
MLHTIRLAAELAAPRAEIYAMYLNARAHAAITGAPVTIAPREGAAFEAFDGALSGQILHLAPDRMIVQTWRSNVFKRADADSILILTLLPHGRGGTLLDLQQINIPEQDYAGASQGWELYYFAPWRDYLTMRKAQRARRRRKSA